MDRETYRTLYETEDSYWWSLGVRKIMHSILQRHVARRDLTVLNAGCATGGFSEELERYGTVLGLDLSREALELCRERGQRRLCQADVAEAPFRSESFDLIIAADLLEHLDDDAAALRELHRLCRQGGWILINVPASPILWGVHDEALGHKRRYVSRDLRAKVSAAGLTIERMTHMNFLLYPAAFILRVSRRLLRMFGRQGEPRFEVFKGPEPVNRFLLLVLAIESRLLNHINLPKGISILCLARR